MFNCPETNRCRPTKASPLCTRSCRSAPDSAESTNAHKTGATTSSRNHAPVLKEAKWPPFSRLQLNRQETPHSAATYDVQATSHNLLAETSVRLRYPLLRPNDPPEDINPERTQTGPQTIQHAGLRTRLRPSDIPVRCEDKRNGCQTQWGGSIFFSSRRSKSMMSIPSQQRRVLGNARS